MKNNTKALYVLIIFILCIGIVSGVMTYNTYKYIDNLVVTGNLNVTGNTTINNYYGEMYCKNDLGCGVVDLVTSDIYVTVKNQTAGNMNGFILTNSTNLTALVGGIYSVNAKASISNGLPAGEFGMKIFVNETGKDNCYDHFHVGSEQVSMIITCLLKINKGDIISLRFDDHAFPVRDITYYATNVNLVRVGN